MALRGHGWGGSGHGLGATAACRWSGGARGFGVGGGWPGGGRLAVRRRTVRRRSGQVRRAVE